MKRKYALTKSNILAAAILGKGRITEIALILGCSNNSVYEAADGLNLWDEITEIKLRSNGLHPDQLNKLYKDYEGDTKAIAEVLDVSLPTLRKYSMLAGIDPSSEGKHKSSR